MAAFFNLAILDSTILVFSSHTHSLLPRMVPTFSTKKSYWHFPPHHLYKKTSLIHSHSTWWWQPSWILPSCIQPFWIKLWLKLIQSDSNSFILTQLDDGSHLELCHLWLWLNLMIAAILNSAILHSTILHKISSLIHSKSTWLWQPSWILSSLILPSWIQPFCSNSDSN